VFGCEPGGYDTDSTGAEQHATMTARPSNDRGPAPRIDMKHQRGPHQRGADRGPISITDATIVRPVSFCSLDGAIRAEVNA
jgi:hypothetical protein